MNELIPLLDVLVTPDRFDWRFGLFLPRGQTWSLETRCAVLDSQFEEEPDPALIAQFGLVEALGISELQDIIDNLKQQLTSPTPGQRLEAFLYYYEHDAFIDFADGALRT